MKIENKNAQFSVFFHRSYDYSRNLTTPLYMYLCEDTVWFDRSLHYISRMVWHWLFKLILFYCIHLVYTAYNIHTSSFFLHNNNYYKWFITILYSYFSFDCSSSRQPSWSQSAPYVTTLTSSMAVSRTLMANSTCVRLAAPGWGLPCCSVR